MPLVIEDRVRETTIVTGTNDATLLGAVTGFQAFSVIGNGNTTYYTISDQSGGNWEVGLGTYTTAGPTLARTTVLSSSAGGSKVSFPAGTKDVFVTYPSEKAVYLDGSNNVQPALGTATITTGVFSAGTVSAPSITTTGDTNTGIFFPAADTIAFTEGGVESMRINSSGNVGIGTDSPTSKLQSQTSSSGSTPNMLSLVNNTGGAANATGVKLWMSGRAAQADADRGTYIESVTTDTNNAHAMAFATSASGAAPTERMRIDSSGNVKIGTTATTYDYQTKNLALYDGTSSGFAVAGGSKVFQVAVQSGGGIYVGSRSNDATIFTTNDTERMRLDTSGNLLFNSGYGSVATAYGCRAWVNFNGTGTVAIRASGNVSSITDNGTGNYTVNFSTAMPNASYSAVVSVDNGGESSYGNLLNNSLTTSNFKIFTLTGAPATIDLPIVCAAVFR